METNYYAKVLIGKRAGKTYRVIGFSSLFGGSMTNDKVYSSRYIILSCGSKGAIYKLCNVLYSAEKPKDVETVKGKEVFVICPIASARYNSYESAENAFKSSSYGTAIIANIVANLEKRTKIEIIEKPF